MFSSQLIDDLAKMVGGAVNVASSTTAQIQEDIKSRILDAVNRLDLVTREEYNSLQKRLEILEANFAAQNKTTSPKTQKKEKTKTHE
jgi:BMFP domain-containing protein YqiC